MASSSDDSTDIEKLRELEQLLAPACSMAQSLATEWKEKLTFQSWDESDDESEPQPPTEMLQYQAELMTGLSRSLHFASTLAKLMRNDSDTRVVNGHKTFPSGHGQALSMALRHNTVVEQLDLDLGSFFPTQSKDDDENEMKDLLEFLATSTTLVHFGAKGDGSSDRTICSSLLDGISQCQQLRRLEWKLYIEPLAFQRIMTTMQSLQELEIIFNFSSRGPYHHALPPCDGNAIAKAFQSNRTLQKLVVTALGGRSTLTAILAALHEHPTLQELHCSAYGIHGSSVYVAAVSDYVGCPTCKLERLSISTREWTRSDMTRLLSGLQCLPVSAGGLPTTRLRSLRLDRHGRLGLDEEELEVLFAFLETPTKNRRGQPIYESCLNELSLVDNYLSDDSSIRLAASLLPASATDDQDADTSLLTPTIGSQIKTLCLDVNRHSEGFLRHLADNANRVHLQTLELQRLAGAGVACFTHLPKLWSLRKLRLLNLACSQQDLYWIVHGLKDNVSILEVETSDNDGQQFSVAQRRLIDAYGQRNEHWNALIGSSNSAAVANNDTAGTETGTGTTGVTAASTTETPGTAADLCLGSSLLQCVQQLPPTRTTMLNRGLLALGQRIADEASNDDEPRTIA